MKLLEYKELPKEIKKRFKEKHLNEFNKIHKSMGVNPNQWTKESAWENELKNTFFIEEPGNVYFSFKLIKI